MTAGKWAAGIQLQFLHESLQNFKFWSLEVFGTTAVHKVKKAVQNGAKSEVNGVQLNLMDRRIPLT